MKIVLMLSLSLAVAACDRGDAAPTGKEQTAANVEAAKLPADNTKKNERDRENPTLTPTDQGENEVDRTITQNVRQGVIKNDSLSTTAKNVKIITVDGVVTLRGPVKSDKEKSDIAMFAQQVQGVKRVDNQLEIATN
jgi:osmotically-inducible protein OsmY